MKKLLVIILLLMTVTLWGQEQFRLKLESDFKWEAVELKNDSLKAVFIMKTPGEFEYYRKGEGLNVSDLDSCLHVMDFNGDGLDDVIFDGLSGGEARMIAIFINKGRSFTKIFTGFQQIIHLFFDGKRVDNFYLKDWGCCCDYYTMYRYYEVDYSHDLPKVKLISQSQSINYIELPQYNNPSSFEFKVISDNCPIRFEPRKDDNTINYYCGEPRTGNSIGSLNEGVTGYALATKMDSLGNVWCFVAIKPDAKVNESMFEDKVDENPTYKHGWIRRNLIEFIASHVILEDLPSLKQYSDLYFDPTLNRSYYLKSDVMPAYPGGINALLKAISKCMQYPLSCSESEISGTVYLAFIVEADGKLSHPKIIRSFLPQVFNEEALRVIDCLGDWIPGQLNSENVAVRYVLPIRFSLQH